jgi:DNA-binding Lrp family transcriptional regulator
MSSSATSQKARTEPAAMPGLPLDDVRERIWTFRPKVFPTFGAAGTGSGRIFPVDAIDRKILALLQEDGRLTVTELAGKVGLSVSPCHRRLRELERDGTIRGYRAVVDPVAVGLTFEALVFVTMRQEDRETLLGFEAAVERVPNVIQAQRLFGDPDYLLRIVTADLAAYQQLEDDVLATLPGVQRLNSTLVMKRIVTDRPLPA